MPTKQQQQQQQQQQDSTKSMQSLSGRAGNITDGSHKPAPSTSQQEQGGEEMEKENLVAAEDSERELSIDSFCERESVLEQLFCDMEDVPGEEKEEEEEESSPHLSPSLSTAVAVTATTATSTVYPTHSSSCHLDPHSSHSPSSYSRLPHPPSSHPHISHSPSSHPHCPTSHFRPQPIQVVSMKTSLPPTSSITTSSTSTSSTTCDSAAGEFEEEEEEDPVFWTMVVNTLEEEEEGRQQSGEDEQELNDVIDQLFFDDDVNQQQNQQGLPPPLPADGSDKDVEIVPCRRGKDELCCSIYATIVTPLPFLIPLSPPPPPLYSPPPVCSQEDIERKRQLAKRKLQQRLRTI